MGTDHPHENSRILALQALRDPDVTTEGGRARVHHHLVVLAGERDHPLDGETVGRRVDQAATGHERGGLGEPGRVPERADLSTRLVPGSCAAIEAFERGRMEEQRPERHDTLRHARDCADWPRQTPGVEPDWRPGERSSSPGRPGQAPRRRAPGCAARHRP